MGLLDDAIREHLELKRRRGADPEEVAREQREVLDVDPQANPDGAETAAADSSPPSEAPVEAAGASTGASDPALDSDAGVAAEQPQQAATLGETAELDMSSVLSEESHAPVAAVTPVEEDSLEWEVPSEAAEDAPEEQAEDVLEETPEFLRDTPEQDRLWFEQRPPRDFDFDK
jgi:hypothetical protein